MKICVLGCGRWGSFIAWYLNKIGNEVTLWGRESSEALKEIKQTHKNEYVAFPESINLSSDLTRTISQNDYVVISISAQHLREFMTQISQIDGYKNKKYILCMKGLEASTGARLSTILLDFDVPKNNVAVWVGPGHIQSFVQGIPSLMVIDSYNPELSAFLVKHFKSELIRFYQGSDIIGSEIGAAAKNVIGIAAGMLDGMGHMALKGSLMARGSREVARLIRACGGKELSAYGLCHLGDYEATLFSEYSQNRMWGEKFAKNESYSKLAEGVATSEALLKLGEKYNSDLPITQIVFDVIHGNITKENAIKTLINRPNTDEFKKIQRKFDLPMKNTNTANHKTKK